MEYGVATIREIFSQPAVWRSCLQALDRVDLLPLVADKSPGLCRWVFVGCGTSYYLAQAAAATLSSLTGVPARALPASEMLLFPALAHPHQEGEFFPVLISRSGHTTEVVKLAESLNRRGIDFLAVTCDGNELAQISKRLLTLPVVESSTVMTSSFTAMLLGLQYVAAKLAGQEAFIEALRNLPDAMEKLLEVYAHQVEKFAQQAFDDVAILAQGALYPIAQEASLKVMESSSTYAQFFHTLEFRHGPKSIVSDRVMVGALISESSYAEECAVLLEMAQLGACTLAVANRFAPEARGAFDLAIELSLDAPEIARLIVYVVWGQLLGSYMGLRKGLDPDSPRHLSRVVTIG